jgi:hypothetical protein
MNKTFELDGQPKGHVGLAVLTLGFVLVSMAATYGTVVAVTEALGLLSTVAMVSLCTVSWVLAWLAAEKTWQVLVD